jgi:endonuclease/exonuclease/phosphatase (EEP) superfamily protein YafD
LLNLENDLYLCGIYIPPEKKTYFDTEIFDNLENEITSFSAKGDVMLVGDFNARTGETNIYLILPRIIIMK